MTTPIEPVGDPAPESPTGAARVDCATAVDPAVGGDGSGVTLARLLDEMRVLQASFDAKIRYDEVRERSVQSMSDELAAYRENQAQRQLRPLLIDLITLRDDLAKVGEAADRATDTARLLDQFRDAVEQILARNGVDPFTVEGDVLDRTRQRVITVLPSDDPSANRRIAQRLRPGFQWYDRVLRPEWVSVYRYAAPSPPPGPTVPAGPPPGPTAVPIPPAVPEADEGVLR